MGQEFGSDLGYHVVTISCRQCLQSSEGLTWTDSLIWLLHGATWVSSNVVTDFPLSKQWELRRCCNALYDQTLKVLHCYFYSVLLVTPTNPDSLLVECGSHCPRAWTPEHEDTRRCHLRGCYHHKSAWWLNNDILCIYAQTFLFFLYLCFLL